MRAIAGKVSKPTEPAKVPTGRPRTAPQSLLPGNQALLRLYRKCECGGSGCDKCDEKKPVSNDAVQAKLEVSQPGDPLELEADNAANQVLNTRRSAFPRLTRYQTQSLNAIPQTGPVGPTIRRALWSGGQPLDHQTRSFADERFGYDFSSVRVHTGPAAEASARSIDAQAYTVGEHIVFNRGRYAPSTDGGRQLIAHELAHVVQQGPVISRQPEELGPCPQGLFQEGEGMSTAMGGDLEAIYGAQAYAIWGTWKEGETPKSFYSRIYAAWLVWRFGKVDPALATKLVEVMTSSTQVFIDKPKSGCQYPSVMSLKQLDSIVRAVAKQDPARQAEEREAESGLPAIDHTLQPGEIPKEKAANIDEAIAQEISAAEPIPNLGSQFMGGKGGGKANAPALPAKVTGPDRQAAHGLGTYEMRLEYWPAGYDLLSQVVEAMNWVDYHWELYNITNMVKGGLAEDVAKARAQEALNPDAAVGKMDPTKRRAEITEAGLEEDTANAVSGLLDPLGEATGLGPDVVAQRAIANFDNVVLLPASAIIALGGSALGALADAVGGDFNEQEIPWGKSGFYMIRCIAQPSPQGENDEMRRAPSVAVKVVDVREHKELAKSGLGDPEADIAELKLAQELEKDEDKKKEIEDKIKEREVFASGSVWQVLKDQLERKKTERDSATGRRKDQLSDQVKAIEKQIALAESREADFITPPMRPRAVIASEVTGEAYPLLLDVGRLNSEAGVYTYRVSDVTSKKGEYWDGGGNDVSKAVWSAMKNMAGHNDYGRGTLAIRFPDDSGIYPLEDHLRNAPHDTKVAEQRIQDLISILVILGLFIPGVGEAAAVLGAAMAAARLIKRLEMGTFEWDAEAIGDTIALLGAAAQGVSEIGKARVLRAGNTFVIATEEGAAKAALEVLEKAEKTMTRAMLAEKVIGYGGFIWGEVQVLDKLVELSDLEAQGLITHSEARRQRAELIFQGIKDAAIQVAQERSKFKQQEEPAVRKSADDPETTIKDEPGKTPAEKTPGGQTADPSGAEPAKKATKFSSLAETPDGRHRVFVTEQGSVWRCSSPSCGDIRAHYETFLKAQAADPVSKSEAEGHLNELTRLEGEAKTAKDALDKAKGTPDEVARQADLDVVTQEVAKLDQQIREFAGRRVTGELGLDPGVAKRTEMLLEWMRPEDIAQLKKNIRKDDFQKFMEQSGTDEATLQTMLQRVGIAWAAVTGDAEATNAIIGMFKVQKTAKDQAKFNKNAAQALDNYLKFRDKYPGRVTGWFLDRFLTLESVKGAQREQTLAEIKLAEDLLTGQTILGSTSNVEGISDKSGAAGVYNPDYRATTTTGDVVIAESKRISPEATTLEASKLADPLDKATRQVISQVLRTKEAKNYIRLDASHMDYKAYDISNPDPAVRAAALDPILNRIKGNMWSDSRVLDPQLGTDVSVKGRDYVQMVEVQFKDATGKRVSIVFSISPTQVAIASERAL